MTSTLVLMLIAAITTDSAPRAPKPPPPLRFTGDAGFVSTGGNSSVQTLNLGDKLTARLGAFTLTQQLGVVHGSSNGATVASSWRGLLRTDMVVHRGIGAYASMTYERNALAGLASRVGAVVGLSARVVGTGTDKLVFEGGVSLTSQRATTSTVPDKDFLGGRAATTYVRQVGRRASISQSVELLPDFRQGADLRINAETALLAPVTRVAALRISYAIHYDGVPEPGYLETDRLLTTGIQITL